MSEVKFPEWLMCFSGDNELRAMIMERERTISRLQSDKDKLVECLKFYAHPAHYETIKGAGMTTVTAAVKRDKGTKARDTLKELESEQ